MHNKAKWETTFKLLVYIPIISICLNNSFFHITLTRLFTLVYLSILIMVTVTFIYKNRGRKTFEKPDQQTIEIYSNIDAQQAQFPDTKKFALEKNKASLSVLILIVIILVYAVADGIFINPLEIVSYPNNIFLLFILPIAPMCFLAVNIFAVVIYIFMIRFLFQRVSRLYLAYSVFSR